MAGNASAVTDEILERFAVLYFPSFHRCHAARLSSKEGGLQVPPSKVESSSIESTRCV
jgi:hypothetical protein